MPTIREISATTTSISMRVTPALVFPANDVGIDPISAGLAVGAVTDNVGLVSVITRKTIHVGMVPGIVLDLLLKIRTLPILDVLRPLAQRLQALIGGRENARVQFVGSQRG